VLKKEEEKISHYTPLSYEIRKLHKVSTCIVPLVVGALGVVTENLEANLSLVRCKCLCYWDSNYFEKGLEWLIEEWRV